MSYSTVQMPWRSGSPHGVVNTAADAVAERLVKIALSRRTKDSDVIAAAKDLLDRAGVRAERVPATTSTGREDGTILWEEFVQNHRLRFGDGTTHTTD